MASQIIVQGGSQACRAWVRNVAAMALAADPNRTHQSVRVLGDEVAHIRYTGQGRCTIRIDGGEESKGVAFQLLHDQQLQPEWYGVSYEGGGFRVRRIAPPQFDRTWYGPGARKLHWRAGKPPSAAQLEAWAKVRGSSAAGALVAIDEEILAAGAAAGSGTANLLILMGALGAQLQVIARWYSTGSASYQDAPVLTVPAYNGMGEVKRQVMCSSFSPDGLKVVVAGMRAGAVDVTFRAGAAPVQVQMRDADVLPAEFVLFAGSYAREAHTRSDLGEPVYAGVRTAGAGYWVGDACVEEVVTEPALYEAYAVSKKSTMQRMEIDTLDLHRSNDAADALMWVHREIGSEEHTHALPLPVLRAVGAEGDCDLGDGLWATVDVTIPAGTVFSGMPHLYAGGGSEGAYWLDHDTPSGGSFPITYFEPINVVNGRGAFMFTLESRSAVSPWGDLGISPGLAPGAAPVTGAPGELPYAQYEADWQAYWHEHFGQDWSGSANHNDWSDLVFVKPLVVPEGVEGQGEIMGCRYGAEPPIFGDDATVRTSYPNFTSIAQSGITYISDSTYDFALRRVRAFDPSETAAGVPLYTEVTKTMVREMGPNITATVTYEATFYQLNVDLTVSLRKWPLERLPKPGLPVRGYLADNDYPFGQVSQTQTLNSASFVVAGKTATQVQQLAMTTSTTLATTGSDPYASAALTVARSTVRGAGTLDDARPTVMFPLAARLQAGARVIDHVAGEMLTRDGLAGALSSSSGFNTPAVRDFSVTAALDLDLRLPGWDDALVASLGGRGVVSAPIENAVVKRQVWAFGTLVATVTIQDSAPALASRKHLITSRAFSESELPFIDAPGAAARIADYGLQHIGAMGAHGGLRDFSFGYTGSFYGAVSANVFGYGGADFGLGTYRAQRTPGSTLPWYSQFSWAFSPGSSALDGEALSYPEAYGYGTSTDPAFVAPYPGRVCDVAYSQYTSIVVATARGTAHVAHRTAAGAVVHADPLALLGKAGATGYSRSWWVVSLTEL